ncbi:MAG TPA: aldo/keto reductase [Planosporangium sp.]|nr:aldo/keto reductase [Planosporangium sp.]
MSEFYGPADEADSIKTIHRALELGVNFLDTADMYGTGHNERLVGRAIADRRDPVVLATKFGIAHEAADHCLVAFNTLVGTSGDVVTYGSGKQFPPSDVTLADNILVGKGSAAVTGTGGKDVGADEFNQAAPARPLTAADVGPNAP